MSRGSELPWFQCQIGTPSATTGVGGCRKPAAQGVVRLWQLVASRLAELGSHTPQPTWRHPADTLVVLQR